MRSTISNPQLNAAKNTIIQDALEQGTAAGIPGLSVSVGIGGEIAWQGAAGYSDVLRQVQANSGGCFGIGSITKTFVARVVIQLVQEGLLDLSRAAAEYLPSEVITGIPNINKATLYNLLQHQSGIPSFEDSGAWIRAARGEGMAIERIWGKEETLVYVRGIPALFQPGQRYAYSNTNYTLLGLIVEAVTGRELEKEIRDRILVPLDLEHTYFESFEQGVGPLTHHYHFITPAFKELAGIHPGCPEIRPGLIETTATNLSCEWAAGGMISTAGDLLRWAHELRAGLLIDEEFQRLIFSHQPPIETDSSEVEYMLGVLRIPQYWREFSAVGHGGATLGFTARMFWLEPSEVTVVLLTNVGEMHTGIRPSPTGTFYKNVLLPAVFEYMDTW